MIRRLAPFALALAIALSGCASPRGPEQGDAAAVGAPPRVPAQPTLWRVTGEREGLLHLLGSVHVGPRGGWQLPAPVERARADADVLVVELDPRVATPENLALLLYERGTLPGGRTLRDRLEAETYAKLEARLADGPLSLDQVERFEPWAVSLMLMTQDLQTLDLQTQSSSGESFRGQPPGLWPETGVDRHVFETRDPLQDVLALELPAAQIELFDGLSDDLQDQMLEDALLQSGDGSQVRVLTLVEAWQRGDDDALERLTFEDLESHPELEPFYEEVFFVRNRNMAKTLDDLLDEGENAFAVVGAGHLVGEQGIVALLAARGYAVERIPTRPAAR